MIAYRVVRRRYADLSGEGARLHGGRFNPPGIAAVYTAQNIALAVLEVLVHLDKSEVPDDYVVMAISFPGRSISPLKRGDTIRAEGLNVTEFRDALSDRTVLRVPSVIVPREHNYVQYPESGPFQTRIEWVEPLDFDRRLFGSHGRRRSAADMAVRH